jgi:hypothetical protein
VHTSQRTMHAFKFHWIVLLYNVELALSAKPVVPFGSHLIVLTHHRYYFLVIHAIHHVIDHFSEGASDI